MKKRMLRWIGATLLCTVVAIFIWLCRQGQPLSRSAIGHATPVRSTAPERAIDPRSAVHVEVPQSVPSPAPETDKYPEAIEVAATSSSTPRMDVSVTPSFPALVEEELPVRDDAVPAQFTDFSEVAGTRRMYMAHAPLRESAVANPDSVENRRILQTMVEKAILATKPVSADHEKH